MTLWTSGWSPRSQFSWMWEQFSPTLLKNYVSLSTSIWLTPAHHNPPWRISVYFEGLRVFVLPIKGMCPCKTWSVRHSRSCSLISPPTGVKMLLLSMVRMALYVLLGGIVWAGVLCCRLRTSEQLDATWSMVSSAPWNPLGSSQLTAVVALRFFKISWRSRKTVTMQVISLFSVLRAQIWLE